VSKSKRKNRLPADRRMIWIDRSIHQDAKIRAAETQITVRTLTENAILHYLDLGDATRRVIR
jgi:hypothetical protein